MPEQSRHLANKYEDIVNLQGAGHIVVASRTACCICMPPISKHSIAFLAYIHKCLAGARLIPVLCIISKMFIVFCVCLFLSLF